MKIPRRQFLVWMGVFLLAWPLQVQAKKRHKSATPAPLATPSSEPPPMPAEAAPQINPAAPPSASLQPFMDTHLSELLSPLGVSAFAQPGLIASMKASYADGLAAAPASHRAAYQLAESVCDAMAGAITERENAVVALRGALATRSSEAEQPRGGGEAVKQARDRDTFFIDSEKNTWIQHATALSQSITALYLRERTVERQIGPWNPPPAPVPLAAPPAPANPTTAPAAVSGVAATTASPAPTLVAAPMPPVSEPPAPTPGALPYGSDPVIGQWLLEGRSKITLGADHSISGDRHGTWSYTCTTNDGRNYELHWPPPKNWTDYLVLSGDARSMNGKTRKNKGISYFRP